MSRFSSFGLKTSSHQEWWFDGLTWPNRPELHKIKCAARCRSLSKWPTGKQITRTALGCRTDYSLPRFRRFIGAMQLPTPVRKHASDAPRRSSPLRGGTTAGNPTPRARARGSLASASDIGQPFLALQGPAPLPHTRARSRACPTTERPPHAWRWQALR